MTLECRATVSTATHVRVFPNARQAMPQAGLIAPNSIVSECYEWHYTILRDPGPWPATSNHTAVLGHWHAESQSSYNHLESERWRVKGGE